MIISGHPFFFMQLSVIIPIYNEASTCFELIENVKSVPLNKQIIVVDDASTDGSYDILKSIDDILLISHKSNQGKGASIKTAIPHITGDFVIFQDGDLEYTPDDYVPMLEKISNNDAVFGSRFLPSEQHLTYHTVGNKLITRFFNIVTGTSLNDIASCYKLLPVQLLHKLNIQSNGFGLESEISTKLVKGNYRITEIPIEYKRRSKHEGKKLRLIDGIIAAWTILKYNFKY